MKTNKQTQMKTNKQKQTKEQNKRTWSWFAKHLELFMIWGSSPGDALAQSVFRCPFTNCIGYELISIQIMRHTYFEET